MSINGGFPAPETLPAVRVRVCCARCRRGTKQFGELPCGYGLNCPNGCHDKRPS